MKVASKYFPPDFECFGGIKPSIFPLSVQKNSLTNVFIEAMSSVLKENENFIGSVFQHVLISSPLQNFTKAKALYGIPPLARIFQPSSSENVYCPEVQIADVQGIADPADPPPAQT